LNSYHTNIQFTYEEEKDNSLPFLDILITKIHNGTLDFNIYRKKTHTDRYLNYDSFHINSHKISVIDSLVTRAFNICKSENLENELSYITKSLENNGYPKKVIKKRIDYLNSKIPSAKDEKPRLILPFIGDTTYKLIRILKSNVDINFGFLTGKKIGSLICNQKEKYPYENCGIYQIKCNNCNKCYIGETTRDFKIRLKEHEADIRHKRIQKSAVALHMSQNPGHEIDLTKSNIIEKEPRWMHRKYKESMYIRNSDHTMNLDKGLHINTIWSSVLQPLFNKL